MTKPFISIIMPAYNAERHIAESIRSVLDQTYSRWELIIVNDGSTDSTADVVREFLDLDSRIKYFYQENKKLSAARNTGITFASGDFIALLDSDDLWMREKLELQVKTLEETNADVVFSSGFMFDENDTANETVPYPSFEGEFTGAQMFKSMLVEFANRIPVLSALARKSVVSDAGLFDENPALHYGAEDYDLWLRLAKHGAVFYGMSEKLVRYRVHANAMSRKKAELTKSMVVVMEKHCHDESLTRGESRKMFGNAYRALTAALVAEGRAVEARESMKKLIASDGLGFKTIIFRVLMKIAPAKFDALNKRRLSAQSKGAAS
jgi:teichuronic acid biosynthesis glycosyltransferase TuaG